MDPIIAIDDGDITRVQEMGIRNFGVVVVVHNGVPNLMTTLITQ